MSNGTPILAPIYCDSNGSFLAVITELLSCFNEQLKKNSTADLRPTSLKTQPITTLLEGAAKVFKKTYNSPQFTKFIPEHDADKIYSVADLNLWI
ncbi:unnamed protein product [Anisakis simplex]|uniref:Pyocin activator protein PrtN n=1 Tax=Anisakis simplex TaxID=6269 RepID=A0A0M3J7I5_ANISI|nr:unnamed protein product [Anisakis simplex]